MQDFRKKSCLIGLCWCVLVLGACRGVDRDGNNNDGELTIGITDGPIELADEVVITFTGIEVKPSDEPAEIIDFGRPEEIDLLEYQNGERFLLLDEFDLEAGNYNWIRLIVDDSVGANTILNDTGTHDLEIPSGAESGFTINSGFTIVEGEVLDFTIDFDLRKSIRETGTDQYTLRPRLRIVNTDSVATISGEVDTTLINQPFCNEDQGEQIGHVVYLFAGAGANLEDINSNSITLEPSPNNPIVTAGVELNNNNAYEFHLSFIADGNYTLAFTCDAEHDDPQTLDNTFVEFPSVMDITVTNGTTAPILMVETP